MEIKKKEISSYFENLSLFLIGVCFILFPLFFLTTTTDVFGLPKQLLLGVVSCICLLLFSAKMINEGKITIRRTPFDLPILLFLLAAFASSILSVDRFSSLIAFVPLLFAVMLYAIIVNTAKKENEIVFLLSCLVAGAAFTSIVAISSYFNVNILPFAFTKVRGFTPLGSALDQALYFAFVLPIAAYFAYPLLKSGVGKDSQQKSLQGRYIGFAVGSLLILAGLAVTIIALATFQKPLILPLQIGFQTAFASISQDTGRVWQGFFFGSGFGTYVTDFTRFKPASFNTDATLWFQTFFNSSSFLLELLATTGFLGIVAFLFLVIQILKERPLFLPLVVAIAALFVLPFSFTLVALFFIMVGLFAAIQGSLQKNPSESNKFFDVELRLVTLRRGIIEFATTESHRKHEMETLLPIVFSLIVVLLVGFVGFFSVRYFLADTLFQQSLVAASQNNGLATYNDQTQSLSLFPYNDNYQRVYAQVNLNLANALVASTPKGSSPSAQTQQNVVTLIQQSIQAGRNATTIAPNNVFNWQGLSSVYRSLIGFGQNADAFAILTAQQAIALDPTNPQEYINLGGIYYQLGQWDNAITQFRQATLLKQDLPNAYYNLGHAYEQKGDLTNALSQYQVVQTLVANDPVNSKKIAAEIAALQKRIGSAKAQTSSASAAQPSAQTPLQVNAPSTTLPPQQKEIKIPAPKATVTPTPTPTK